MYPSSSRSGPRFVAAEESRPRNGDSCLIPVGCLTAIDSDGRNGSNGLQRLVRGLGQAGCELDEVELYRRLLRVTTMRRRELVNHPRRDDILEIFARLNSRGMRFRRVLLKLLMKEIPAAIRGIRGRYQP